MADREKLPLNTEKILISIDHIGETVEIMTEILERLRKYVEQESTHRDINSILKVHGQLNLSDHNALPQIKRQTLKKPRTLH